MGDFLRTEIGTAMFKIVKATVAVVAVFALTGPVSAQTDMSDDGSVVCGDRIAFELEQHGLKMSDLNDVRWQTDMWGNQPRTQQVGGYQMHAQPSSCSEGGLVVEMWANCGIQDIYTMGGCKLPNIKSF